MKGFLYDIAYGRSGDKGSSANIGIIAYNQLGYDYLYKNLTAEKVQQYFKELKPSVVIRYELPNLLAFNFVLNGALQGGGSRSLRLDSQGKALAQALLNMPFDFPDQLRGSK